MYISTKIKIAKQQEIWYTNILENEKYGHLI